VHGLPAGTAAAAGLLLLLACLLPVPAAAAGEGGRGEGGGRDGSRDAGNQEKPQEPAGKVGEKEARSAMETFEVAVAVKEPEARRTAVRELARYSHPLIAKRLLRLAVSDEPSDLRAEAFRALGRQAEDTARLARAVSSWLEAEAKESRKALAKGDFGLVMDRRTGEPVLDTPEGRAALEAKRARGRMLAASVELLARWKHRSGGFREAVVGFLQDGEDGLVAACLRLLGG